MHFIKRLFTMFILCYAVANLPVLVRSEKYTQPRKARVKHSVLQNNFQDSSRNMPFRIIMVTVEGGSRLPLMRSSEYLIKS